MPTLDVTPKPDSGRVRVDNTTVLQALVKFCSQHEVGTVLPSRTEWMERLNASERSVRWALEALQHQGRIMRPVGGRKFVVTVPPKINGPLPSGGEGGEGQRVSRTVFAVTVPDHAFFDQAIQLLVKQCKEAELAVTCHMLPWNHLSPSDLPTMTQEPLGYVVFRRDLLPLAEALQAEGHRTVFVGTPYAHQVPNVPTVYGDQEQGGYLATRHLLDLGHRRIAFCVRGDINQTLRWRGHERALREARKRGHEIQDVLLPLDDAMAWNDNAAAATAYFAAPDAPTGIVVWNDHEAANLLNILRRSGIRVPEDVSLVGYDNLPEGRLVHPALTTVYSPVDQQLQAALNILTRPDPVPAPYQLVVFPGLIQRESTAPPGGRP